MEINVLNEWLTIVYGALTGILLGTVYALISVFRRWLKAGTVITAISDILYGMLAAIVVFAFTFIFNNGILRAYNLAAILFGFALPVFINNKIYGYSQRIRTIKKKGSAATVKETKP